MHVFRQIVSSRARLSKIKIKNGGALKEMKRTMVARSHHLLMIVVES